MYNIKKSILTLLFLYFTICSLGQQLSTPKYGDNSDAGNYKQIKWHKFIL